MQREEKRQRMELIKDQFTLRKQKIDTTSPSRRKKRAANKEKKKEEELRKKEEEERSSMSRLKAAQFTGTKIVGLNVAVRTLFKVKSKFEFKKRSFLKTSE